MAEQNVIFTTILLFFLITEIKPQFLDFFNIPRTLPRQSTKYATEHTTRRTKIEKIHTIGKPQSQISWKNTTISIVYEDEGDNPIQIAKEGKRNTTILPVFNVDFFTTSPKPSRKTTKVQNRSTLNFDDNYDNSRLEEGNRNDNKIKLSYDVDVSKHSLYDVMYERPINTASNYYKTTRNNNNYYQTTKPSYYLTTRNNHNYYQTTKPDYYETTRNNNNSYQTTKPNYYETTRNNNSYYQTKKPNYYETTRNNHNYYQTTKHNYYETTRNNNNNYYTTKNPLHHPGVKPAIIDNRPPITNRPAATKRPISRPAVHYPGNPVTNRPRPTDRPETNNPLPKPVTVKPYIVNPVPTNAGAILFPHEDEQPEIMRGLDEDYMSPTERRRYIEIAERMCDKYKALNTKQLQAIPLLPSPSPVEVNVSQCTPTTIPLIVGGKVVTINEFPHMALLGWVKLESGGYSWKCGGSLISEQFVLTAGHCSYQERDNTVESGPPRVVQLGSSYLDDPGALVVRVSKVIRHPKYKMPRSYYDIALLKLVQSVRFSEVIKPACLGVPPEVDEPIIATGWGKTELGGDQSLELRSVSLPVWSMRKCQEVLGTSRKMPDGPSPDSQLCAGDMRGGKDTCQGDSGGPAQIQDGCIWRVVAVTSVGRSCGAPNTPGLYALVHRAFIAAEIFGNTRNNRKTDAYSGEDGSQSSKEVFSNKRTTEGYFHNSNERTNHNPRKVTTTTESYFKNQNPREYHSNERVNNQRRRTTTTTELYYDSTQNNNNYNNDGRLSNNQQRRTTTTTESYYTSQQNFNSNGRPYNQRQTTTEGYNGNHRDNDKFDLSNHRRQINNDNDKRNYDDQNQNDYKKLESNYNGENQNGYSNVNQEYRNPEVYYSNDNRQDDYWGGTKKSGYQNRNNDEVDDPARIWWT